MDSDVVFRLIRLMNYKSLSGELVWCNNIMLIVMGDWCISHSCLRVDDIIYQCVCVCVCVFLSVCVCVCFMCVCVCVCTSLSLSLWGCVRLLFVAEAASGTSKGRFINHFASLSSIHLLYLYTQNWTENKNINNSVPESARARARVCV